MTTCLPPNRSIVTGIPYTASIISAVITSLLPTPSDMIATTAPNSAACETPSVYGELNGFF